MGYAEIPDRPPEKGKMTATIVLDLSELRQTVDLLNSVVAHAAKDAAIGTVRDQQRNWPVFLDNCTLANWLPEPAAVPPAQPRGLQPQAAPAAPQAAFRQQLQQAAQAAQQPVPATQVQPQPQPQGPPQQQPQPQPRQQQQPQPQPRQQQQQQRPQPRQEQQQPQVIIQHFAPTTPTPSTHLPAPSAVSAGYGAVAPAPTAAAAASSKWQLEFASNPEDHGNAGISSLAYAQALPGLPGGDGHSGWLVAASKGMLNLWETSRAASGDEMALLCMHSQAVDLLVSKLVLEPNTRLMFGASMSSKDASESISVHSLDPEVGLLAYRYKFAPPPGRPRPAQRLMQQVISLHGMNPSMSNNIIASYGERLLVFDAKPGVRANSVLHDAKHHFIAHANSNVTTLHRSSIEGSCIVVSGAQDGKVHMWDLRTKPQAGSPAARMVKHSGGVSGLALVSNDRLVSGSLDGTVLLWDLRSPLSPLYTAGTPGKAGVLRMAPGPWGDVLAVATAKGLHCIELFEFGAPMSNIAGYPLWRPFSDIVFNAVTHDLYAGSGNGSVVVFSRRS